MLQSGEPTRGLSHELVRWLTKSKQVDSFCMIVLFFPVMLSAQT